MVGVMVLVLAVMASAAHLICSARVPRTLARSYLVIYFVVVCTYIGCPVYGPVAENGGSRDTASSPGGRGRGRIFSERQQNGDQPVSGQSFPAAVRAPGTMGDPPPPPTITTTRERGRDGP